MPKMALFFGLFQVNLFILNYVAGFVSQNFQGLFWGLFG